MYLARLDGRTRLVALIRPGVGGAASTVSTKSVMNVGAADAYFGEHRNELGAARGLAGGQDHSQGPAAAVGRQMDFAGPSASRAPEPSGFQTEPAPPPDAPPFGPAGIADAGLSALFPASIPAPIHQPEHYSEEG